MKGRFRTRRCVARRAVAVALAGTAAVVGSRWAAGAKPQVTAGATTAAATTPATTAPLAESELIDTKPTLITARVKDVPAERLLGEISKQAGGTFTIRGAQLPRKRADAPAEMFSAEFDHQPYWDAVREALEATGLRPTAAPFAVSGISGAWQDVQGLTLVRPEPLGPSLPPPVCSVDGAVMFLADALDRTATLDYAAPPPPAGARSPDRVRLQMQVLVEPNFRPFYWVREARVEAAADDRGNALAPAPPAPAERGTLVGPPVGFLGARVGMGTMVPISLVAPPAGGKRISQLRGRVTMCVPRRVMSLDVTPATFGRSVQTPAGDVTVRLGTNDPQPPGAPRFRPPVEVVLRRARGISDAAWAERASTFVMMGAVATRAGAGGAPILAVADAARLSDADVSLRLEFFPQVLRPQPGAEWQHAGGAADLVPLRVDFPAEVQTLEAKFSFKDLPLP